MQVRIASGLLAIGGLCLTATALPSPINGDGTTLQARDDLIWAANFATATNSTEAGFKRQQWQYAGGPVHYYDPGATNNVETDHAVPIIAHPLLGRALKLHLNASDGANAAQQRMEVRPGGPNDFGPGADVYIRMDFALDPDFPLNKTKWNVVNQVHQGSDSGSPPIEFDAQNGHLYAHGEDVNGSYYNLDLGQIFTNTAYKLIYHIKFSSAFNATDGALDVWLNGVQKVTDYSIPVHTLVAPGDSYWKGATAYCDPSLAPFTTYQTNHRYGRTLASVN